MKGSRTPMQFAALAASQLSAVASILGEVCENLSQNDHDLFNNDMSLQPSQIGLAGLWTSHFGCDCGGARAAFGDPLRQRTGTDESPFLGLVCWAADRTDPHSAGKADAEGTGGEFSRKVA